MRQTFREGFLSCSPWVYFGVCFLLLLLPLRWFAASIAAALIHEFFHVAAIYITGGRILRIRIGHTGAQIVTQYMTPFRELICTLAGPIGGLMLLLFSRWIPLIAVCGAFQSAFNLLPVYPLDGARAFRCAIILVFGEERGYKIIRIAERVTGLCLIFLCVYCTFILRVGLLPLIVAAIVISRRGKQFLRDIKIPCKDGKVGVQ